MNFSTSCSMSSGSLPALLRLFISFRCSSNQRDRSALSSGPRLATLGSDRHAPSSFEVGRSGSPRSLPSWLRYLYKVDLPTPSIEQISSTECSPSSFSLLAGLALPSSSALGLPPRHPRALAEPSPATVLSRMISLSNSAKAPKTWKISLPPAVVVSRLSLRLRNPTPRPSSSPTRSINSRRDLPSRSSLATTSTSPSRQYSNASRNSGLSASLLETFSSKILSQPSAERASRCDSSLWSCHDTLAYPTLMLALSQKRTC